MHNACNQNAQEAHDKSKSRETRVRVTLGNAHTKECDAKYTLSNAHEHNMFLFLSDA